MEWESTGAANAFRVMSSWVCARRSFSFSYAVKLLDQNDWSGRVDLNHRPPGPENAPKKIQVLHLASLRSQKAILSPPQLYRSCSETPGDRTLCVPSGR